MTSTIKPCVKFDVQMTLYLCANDVERESEGAGGFDRAKKDPAINHRVRVIQGPLKGSAGYIITKNYTRGLFVVGLESSGVAMNFFGSQLVYL